MRSYAEQAGVFVSVFPPVLMCQKQNKTNLCVETTAPPLGLKIHGIYRIGRRIPKYTQFDKAGIKVSLCMSMKGGGDVAVSH